jgi:glycosyltransferase involved in cell wall biosynthesis
MIWIFSDYLTTAGGIETYLHALCLHLKSERITFRVVVCEMATCPVVDELVAKNIRTYRQKRIPGDRWSVRQHVLCTWLFLQLQAGDWVFCVRQPREEIYERLVRGVHKRGARLAASWMFTPDALSVKVEYQSSFNRAVAQTDAVISVSRRGAGMYKHCYGYAGKVHVVPYHNLSRFPEPLELAAPPPWRFGFLGRLEDSQKNLFSLLEGFSKVASIRKDVLLDIHGGGPDLETLQDYVYEHGLSDFIRFYGPYDHRTDLPQILNKLHCVIYTSKFEGGPCFSLLEAMQAGRFAIASAVGGIPDLYVDHPEAGILISEHFSDQIADGITKVARMLDVGSITTVGPRKVYDEGFTVDIAHQAWLTALGLAEVERGTID